MTTVPKMADRYLELKLSTDSIESLWKGSLDYLEDWEDVTPEGKATRIAAFRRMAEAARGTVPDSIEEASTLDTIAHSAAAHLEELTFREETTWVNPTIGLHALVVAFLPRYRLSTREHGLRYLRRLENLAVLLDQTGVQILNASHHGRTANHSILAATMANLDRHLGMELLDDPLAAQPTPTELTEAGAVQWRQGLLDTIDRVVRPALARHRGTLAAVLTDARPDSAPGLCHIEDGGGLYERLAWSYTTLHLTPQEIHQIGIEQVERLEEEYRQVSGPLLGTTDLDTVYRRLREDPNLYYQDAESLIADATETLRRANQQAGDWFLNLPAAQCVAESADSGPLASYSQPSDDGTKPGSFMFNTQTPSMWGRYQIQSVTFHESVPGHHLQIALSLENPDLHPVHSQLAIGAYAEGWGLYAERLADEMGLYSSDFDRLGMLADDSLRACRLVVDTGMHALGWSRDRAIGYLLAHSPLPRLQVESEVDRYIGLPGQALGYMIGRLEIERLRSEVAAELGDAFNLKSFHDAVLSTGSVPLRALRRAVDHRLRPKP